MFSPPRLRGQRCLLSFVDLSGSSWKLGLLVAIGSRAPQNPMPVVDIDGALAVCAALLEARWGA